MGERIRDKIAASKKRACGWVGWFLLDMTLTAGSSFPNLQLRGALLENEVKVKMTKSK
jgi:hypothetical protein